MQISVKPIIQKIPVGIPLAFEKVLLNHVPLGKNIFGSDTIKAERPRDIIIVPRVAIKAGIFNFAISIPLMNPKRVPMAIMIGIVSHKF